MAATDEKRNFEDSTTVSPEVAAKLAAVMTVDVDDLRIVSHRLSEKLYAHRLGVSPRTTFFAFEMVTTLLRHRPYEVTITPSQYEAMIELLHPAIGCDSKDDLRAVLKEVFPFTPGQWKP